MEHKYLQCAVEAALEAGRQILTIYNDPGADFGIEKKADHSPLTLADKKSHETILSFLSRTPYPVLSEEGRNIPYAERKEWPLLWIVDPLDGTKEFIKRNGEFTVNIALVKEGVPVMGVIYIPVQKQLYFAAEGLGAWRVTDITEFAGSLEELMATARKLPVETDRERFVVVASRSHLSPETATYIEDIRKQHASVELISVGSSLKICRVAEGEADLYPRFAPTMEWDTAAGHAIACAAGYEMYRAEDGEPLCYNKEELLNPWFIVKKKR
ncbi:MAG: 3'(2'),5'-bisphosphate nucleotidase CysQ [Bacteroides sp.]|nr:3'(2'),5'-bisphosphate nucleotidase CysQ [Bacteroides sp.]